MIIRDNLTRFSVDLQMSKMPKFDWTRIAMLSSLPTFSRSVRTLLIQGVPIQYVSMGFEDHWNMQNLLQANQHLEMTYYGLHPFVKIILDHGSQTSTYCFFKTYLLERNIFCIHYSLQDYARATKKLCLSFSQNKVPNYKSPI